MKLDHIVILLTDLNAGLRFYETLLPLLGFARIRDAVFENNEKIYLDFRQAQDVDHEYRRYAPGLNHLGFTAARHEDLERIRLLMQQAEFEVPEIQHFEQGSAIFFKDMDGMRVEIASYHQ